MGKILYGINILVLLSSSSGFTRAMPPPNPVQCNQTGCLLHNSYGVWSDRKDCRPSSAVFPATEAELVSAVADANRLNLRVRAVSKFSHTIPKWACPAAEAAAGDGGSVVVSTERYDRGIDVDAANLAVTAEAGVGLRAFIDAVERAGLSLVAAPYWEGVSVAGMISTGAHGSSWRGRGGAVHDHVVGLRVVVPAAESEGFAKVVDLKGGDPLLNAAKLSLGLLGVISKVTLSLERGFKRRITLNFTSDEGIENEFMEHATKYEFGDIQWYPSRHVAVYRYDDRVPLDVPGNGVNDFIGFQSNPIFISESTRASEKLAEKTRNAEAKCIMASTFLEFKKISANGLKSDDQIFTGYPVIGRQGRMQTSGSCLGSSESDRLTSCAWDPRVNGLFFYESTAIFTPSKFADFVRDVRKLRDAAGPTSFCGADIYNGFLVRFVRRSEAYLGQAEDSVVVDFNYYRSKEGSTSRLNEDVWEEVEQMAFLKHGAKPHWAKNRNVAFVGVRGKYANFSKFVEAKNVLDPRGLFSGGFSDGMLSEKGSFVSDEDGCALEGMCVCFEDRHCSPRDGYFCRRGLVYKEARACRYLAN